MEKTEINNDVISEKKYLQISETWLTKTTDMNTWIRGQCYVMNKNIKNIIK